MDKQSIEKIKGKSGYAWAVAGAGFAGQLACVFMIFLFGSNMSIIAADFGTVVTELAIGSSLFGLLNALLSAFWGNLADKIGPRIVQSIGAWGVGILMVICGLIANGITMIIALYALSGVFVSALGPGVNPKVISTWFATHYRGKGMTIVTLGGSLAGVVMGILAPILIAQGGWRFCFEVVGGLCILVGCIIFAVMRNKPIDIGTVPFGTPTDEISLAEKEEETVVEVEDKSTSRARTLRILKMPITWKYSIVYIFYMFWMTSYTAFLVSAITYAGFDPTVAGLCLSLQTGAMAVSTIVWPAISDRFCRKTVLGIMGIVYGILYSCMFFVLQAGSDILVFGALVAACFFSATTPIIQTTLAEVYPPDLRGYGPGVVSTIATIGRFFGPLIAAWIISANGGNVTTFFLYAGASILIMGVLAILWLPKTSGKYGDPLAREFEEKQQAKKAA